MDDHADDLLRRALIDAEASAAVALRVQGLPLCDTLTVVFHGRRDLGTIQTYVAHGGRGAGASVSAGELLRVPCDLDLGAAEDREEAEALYAEQAAALRDALVGADTVLDIWREPLEELAELARGGRPPRRSSTSACRPTGCCRPRWSRPSGGWSSRPCAAPGRWPRAARRWGSSAPSRTSPASTRCPTTPSAAWRTSWPSPPSMRAAWPSASSARRRRSRASSSCPATTSTRPG